MNQAFNILPVFAAESEASFTSKALDGIYSNYVSRSDMDPVNREMNEPWEVLREAGPAGFATASDVVALFTQHIRRPLNFRDVAGCLAMFARTWGDSTSLRNSFANLSVNGGPPNPSASLMLGKKAWNIDAFVDAIPKSVNWDLVVRSLDDFPDLKVKSQEVFSHVLVAAYKRATKQNYVPGSCFLGPDWMHADIQAALLMQALNSEEVRFEPTVDGGRDTKWSCVALVETLLRLAERGHEAICYAALQLGQVTDPDSLLLSLLWSKPYSELLREKLYAVLVPALLSRALEDDPDATRVLASVWSLNRELVIRGVLEVLTRDASILDLIIRLLPEGLPVLLRLPLRVSLAAACAATARDPTFKLDKWLTDRFSTLNPEMLSASVREVLKFIENRQQAPNTPVSPKLSPASLTLIFRALQACRAPGMMSEIRRVLDFCRDLDPSLMSTGTPGLPQGGPATPTPTGAGQPAYDDIEEQANGTFQLIYSGQMEIDQVIAMLEKFKDSSDPREQAIFQCMIHNLFDEYRFFQNYPDKELRITGILFGNLIQHRLLSSWTLSMAIKYVLDALRRAPTTPPDAKIFRFGVLALEQFKSRLPELHVITDLLAISHLAEAEPALYADVERAQGLTVSPAGLPTSPATQAVSVLNLPASSSALPLSVVESLEMKRVGSGSDTDSASSSVAGSLPLRGSENADSYALLCKKLDTFIGGIPDEEAPPSPGTEFEDQVQFLINNLTLQNLEEKVAQARKVIVRTSFPWTAYYMVIGRISTQPNFHGLYMQFVDGLNDKQLLTELRLRTLAQVRKLLKSQKIVTASAERAVLKNLGSWLGQLTLAKNKPLLHREIDLKELLLDGYERGWLIAIVPFAAKILTGALNSRVFSPSNPWMVGILSTLAEIYHLSDVKLNLKFEIEVLFRELLIDIQSITPSSLLSQRLKPKLTGNPDFNVKVALTPTVTTPATPLPPTPELSKAFGPPSATQPSQQPTGPSTGGPQSQPPPHVSQLPFAQQPTAGEAPFHHFNAPVYVADKPQQHPVEKVPIPTETVIPNLASYVFVNSQLVLFARHPDLKRVVPVAVDRAIREIIQPAVERSVSIAIITTRELILKDFAMEPDENRLLKAAHLMITNLAGSLALVTCKEHLRLSMGNHLRQLLTSQGLGAEDLALVEQVVQACSAENLELGCLLIEKAATDKALRDIDEALEPAVQVRKEHRETTGQPYYDTSIFNNGMRYPAALPQPLRPRPQEGGLNMEQLAVYDAFQRAARQSIAASRDSNLLGLGSNDLGGIVSPAQGSLSLGLGAGAGAQQLGGGAPTTAPQTAGTPRMLTTAQALEKYRSVVAALDVAVSKLLLQPGFHDLQTSSLPADHEVIQQLHFIRSIVEATAPESRFDVAGYLAHSVCKRLFDGSPTDKLRLSVQVGALEAVSSALDGTGLRGKITEWVLSAIASGKLNVSVTAALVDARLVAGVDLDALLADLLEGMLSTSTCAFAFELVQRCVVQSRMWPVNEAPRTLTALQNIALGQAAIAAPPGLARLLGDVTDIATSQQSAGGAGNFKPTGSAPLISLPTPGEMLGSGPVPSMSPPPHPLALFAFTQDPSIDPQVRKDVEMSLQRWIEVSRDGGSAAQFLAGLKEKALLRGDQAMERFFYLCTELCVESFITIVGQHGSNEQAQPAEEAAKLRLAYTGVDSYGVLVSLLVKLADHRARPTLAAQALEACAKVMAYDVSLRFAQGHESGFDQRPYFRMILNFQRELLSIPSSETALSSVSPTIGEAELADSADKLLAVFAEAHHHYFSPEHAPGFCFAWLELISHHSFMPRLLKEQRGWSVLHRLLVDLFVFMEPYLKNCQLTAAVRVLYKGTLRVLLVLLHDFPEFLCFFHFSLCNVIPPTCVQLRNLILSAFPRTMRLPDPFTPNLKVDLLPEITINPRILADYTTVLDQAHGGLRADVDLYLRTRKQPVEFLSTLKDRLRVGGNWHVMNALVLHVGVTAITWSKIAESGGPDASQSMMYLLGAKDIYQTLAAELDSEGRYQFLNAIANHLRYPNSHTHYFSCVILGLFKEGSELVQEQVTRVLLERLIVHRPHPWGLLVTFIELMKNPRYTFWDHSFTKCTPEIQKVFESVASSCGATQVVS